MPEPVMIIRGFPGGDFELPDPAMVADLDTIGGLSEQQIGQLVSALRVATGFLDSRRLIDLVRGVISEERPVQAVVRALENLEPDDVERATAAFELAKKKEKKSDSSGQRSEVVRRNLKALIQIYPALARFEKAERLATLTGQRLESFDLVCDIRPIFDESRRAIEGMLPYTRLRMVVTGADGLPHSFEAELSAEQVQELLKTAEKATAKLTTLRESMENWLPNSIPVLPMTRVPRKESSNA